MLPFPLFFAAFGFSSFFQLGAFSAPPWKESMIQVITQTPHPPPPPPPPLHQIHNGSCLTLRASSGSSHGGGGGPTPKPQLLSSLKIPIPSTFNHIPHLGIKHPHQQHILSLKDGQMPFKGQTGNGGISFSESAANQKAEATLSQITEMIRKKNPTLEKQKSTDKDKSAESIMVTSIRNENKTSSRLSSNKRYRGTRKRNKKKMKKLQPTPANKHCPSQCVCSGSVVECSDKGAYKVPHGIPNNSSFISLKNNYISSIRKDLLHDYTSLHVLILSNNWLTDKDLKGVFKGNLALKHLHLDNNLLENVPVDLPASLEDLRLDNNYLRAMSEDRWVRCASLSVLSLSNNQLGDGSQSFPDGVLSPLLNLRTLNLSHNQLSSAPLGLPPSMVELYLKANLIKLLHQTAFRGMSKLEVLDLSANRLTNSGLGNSLNVTHLESLNLEGNQLEQVPRGLPSSLKVLNLGSNLITSVKKATFSKLKKLELLSVARNKVLEVAAGAFRDLSFLHQLDFSHNSLQQVPRLLPRNVHSVTLSNNRIQSVPVDAFCWGNQTGMISRLVHMELENNLMDSGMLDPKVLKCIKKDLVVHF